MGLKRSILIPLFGLFVFLIWLVLYSGANHSDRNIDDIHKTTLKNTPVGGDFELNTVEGKISLADFNDKLVLLYFGYTACPNVCPSSLSKISLVLQRLPAKQRAAIKTIFVSLDPEYDTAEKVKEYVQYYNGSFIGAVAEADQLKKITKQYAVDYELVKGHSRDKRLIEHTTYFYLIGTDGKLLEYTPHNVSLQELLEMIKKHLAPQKSDDE